MKVKVLTFIVISLLLVACGGKQQHQRAEIRQLMETADKLGYDTITTNAGDTLCNIEIDNVLRHYPEFYHATKRAKKAYAQWVKQEKKSGLKTVPEVMDITKILDETLYGSDTVAKDSAWQMKYAVDSLYIQCIVNVTENDGSVDAHKSEIGRSRKAWLAYIEQLQNVSQTIPEGYKMRYQSVVADKINNHMLNLLQTNKK